MGGVQRTQNAVGSGVSRHRCIGVRGENEVEPVLQEFRVPRWVCPCLGLGRSSAVAGTLRN